MYFRNSVPGTPDVLNPIQSKKTILQNQTCARPNEDRLEFIDPRFDQPARKVVSTGQTLTNTQLSQEVTLDTVDLGNLRGGDSPRGRPLMVIIWR